MAEINENKSHEQLIVDELFARYNSLPEGKPKKILIKQISKEFLFKILRQYHAMFTEVNTRVLMVSEGVESRIDPVFCSEEKQFKEDLSKDVSTIFFVPGIQNRLYPEDISVVNFQDLEFGILDDYFEEIPEYVSNVVVNDILKCARFLSKNTLPLPNMIRYLSAIKKESYKKEKIGELLYLLDLIPDNALLNDPSITRLRISMNLINVDHISNFTRDLYERVRKVKDSLIQRKLINFYNNEPNISNKSKLVYKIATDYDDLNFEHWMFDYSSLLPISLPNEHITPKYDLMVGATQSTSQFGLIGETSALRKVAIDLSGTNTISLFGVQGAGKSYTIGAISEMVLKQFSHISEVANPLAGVIFHYSESMDYEPEFTAMMYPNSKEAEIAKLNERYGAHPESLDEVLILCPSDKLEQKKREFPSIEICPIQFNPTELNVQDWMFLTGAMGVEQNYVRQLKALIKKHRNNISVSAIRKDVEVSPLFTDFERALALQKLDFAEEYIKDTVNIGSYLKPGRLIVVDLRDEFIDKDEALGLFVVILNIYSAVSEYKDTRFNKFIVFDEAHKYMDNKKLTSTIVTAIREMRHKGVSLLIASQDPPSLPKEIIELSSVVLLHKFNSPKWLEHIKTAITQLEILSPHDMSNLSPGEAYIWATKATERSVTYKPLRIQARPRVTMHGGATILAGSKK